jgi:hypothetical protein
MVITRFQHLLWPQLGCLLLGNYLIIGLFTLYTRILPYGNVIYDIKQLINVRNSVGKSNLNCKIYIIDSTVTENFMITEYAGNKFA